MNRYACLLLTVGWSSSTLATISANLNWTASTDPSVTGYTIYYGNASHQYTQSVTVGAVTNAVISGLTENATYFFAAKASNSAGAQSDFSNEAALVGLKGIPEETLRLKSIPPGFTNTGTLNFALGEGTPAGVSINPTNGSIIWSPGHAFASTTNYIDVQITDTADSTFNLAETLEVVISDFLELQLGSTAAWSGQSGTLSLSAAASSTVTNVEFTLDWPGNELVDPTLSFVPPVLAGSLQSQNNQLVIQLQVDPSQSLDGTMPIVQVNFQTAAGQALSTALGIPVIKAAGNTADGSNYANVQAAAGEVVLVGNQPLLRPKADTSGGRTLVLYANAGNYQLQSTTSLAAGWQPVTTYQQTNAVQTLAVDPSVPCVFYRLQQY